MNVLIYSQDNIGKNMAGPGIRCWEFAKALSKKHHVILSIPNISDIEGEGFEVQSRALSNIKNALVKTNVFIGQEVPSNLFKIILKLNIRVIIDAYDPAPLEILEIVKNLPMEAQVHIMHTNTQKFINSFKIADGILCANVRQRDLWLGFLMGQQALSPQEYSRGSLFNQFIKIVPFGLPSKTLEGNKGELREEMGFSEEDIILLWGGGIWNWFDPLCLIEAVNILVQEGVSIKLVFMGLKHPSPLVPEMEMTRLAVNLSDKLGLTKKNIFFNFGWTPYEKRKQYLIDADIAVSTHGNHLETRYSFRTRILDCLWAELPIICTEGDFFAELVKEKNLGKVVKYKDISGVVEAIKALISSKESYQEIKSNLSKIKSEYEWETVTSPINDLIESFSKKPLRYKESKMYYRGFFWRVKRKLKEMVKSFLKKAFKIEIDKGKLKFNS